jgi:calcium-dependent protein kinase
MEYCSGGELFDRIQKKGRYSEKEAAYLMHKLLHAINHLHVSSISHRDLKPENCLFDTKRDDAEVKLVDFGLASKFSREKGMSTVVGTPYYVAPEIINGHYGPECDIWSLGVILYLLLVGYPPFRGDNKTQIFKKVLKAKYSLKEKEFETISKEAKDLITKLLNPDVKKRITAAQAMEEPWFNIMMHSANERPLDPQIIRRLNTYKSQSKLRVEVIKTMVRFLSDSDFANLKEAFRKLDKNHTGYISAQELEDGLVSIGFESSTEKIRSIMDEADFDKNGRINYTEFIAATLESKIIMKQENVWAAFKKFDIVKSI